MVKEAIVLPVIDLANFPAELEKLAAASTELGCFRVINHGMPVSLMAEMKETVRSLFEIPDEVKLRNVDSSLDDSGYARPNFIADTSFYEAFGVYNAASPADVLSFCSLLNASAHQSQIISDYFGKFHGVTTSIASKVVESLGLHGCCFKDWSCFARLNSYKFKFQKDIGCIGVPIHTDSSFLTVLQDDEGVGGLEIMDANENFVSIDPLPRTFLVQMGDVGKAWSNERLRNVKHRVVCKKATQRISIALFLLAPKDGTIATEAAFIDADHLKLYQNFIYNEYRKQRRISGLRAGEILPILTADPGI